MKKIVSLLLILILALSVFCVPVYAQSYSDKAIIVLSKKNINVGDEVTVTVRHTSSYSMSAIQSTLTYNNAVLQFVSGENGSTANKGSTVTIVKDSAPTNSISVTIKFKAIAAGSGSLSYSGKSFSDTDDGSGAAGTAVNVTELKPSTDNNLGSLRISAGALTPAFKKGRLNYTATVKYDVTKITIRANAAAGDAKVAGVGTFDLNVGDNTRGITVTAASGDKKTYTIKIKRMSEEETAALEDSEKAENPLLFDYEGSDRLLVPDITNLADFEGYEKASFEKEDVKVGYLKDKFGRYNLVWATDEDGKNGTFYNRVSDETYTKINYLQTKGRIYVVEPFESDIDISSQFVLSEQEVNGDTLTCYRYSDEEFKDFCVLYCYLNGESDYYRFDASQNTVQREPMFLSAAQETEVQAEEPEGNIIDKFRQLGAQAKIIILLLCLAGLLIFVLIILLIIKAATAKSEDVEEVYTAYDGEEDDDGIPVPETYEPIKNTAAPQSAVAETAQPEAVIPQPEEETVQPELSPQPREDLPTETQNLTEELSENAEPDDSDIDTSEFIDLDDDF